MRSMKVRYLIANLQRWFTSQRHALRRSRTPSHRRSDLADDPMSLIKGAERERFDQNTSTYDDRGTIPPFL